jgi:hypothetical protein
MFALPGPQAPYLLPLLLADWRVNVFTSPSQDGKHLATTIADFEIRLVRAAEGQEILWVNDRSTGWRCSTPNFAFAYDVVSQQEPHKVKVSWAKQNGSTIMDVGDGSVMAVYLLTHHSAEAEEARRKAAKQRGR